jgi:hypothetical protein
VKKKRPRSERRMEERGARKLVRDREKLAALEVGGSRERPMDVTSSSVIPVRTRAQPCHQCGGSLQLDEERAESSELRAVDTSCQRCGAKRTWWFRITSPLAN